MFQMKSAKKTSQWKEFAPKRVAKLIKVMQKMAQIKKIGPKSHTWSVEVEIIGEAKMTHLNTQYRKKKRPTDVLSFMAPEPFYSQGVLGELVICLPVLKRQAKQRELSPEMELDILLTHGVLHLLGFDHEKTKKAAKEMAQLEVKVLKKIALKKSIHQTKGRCLSGLIERMS